MYDRIGGAELRAQASPGAEFLKYSLTAVCRKIVSDAKCKPLNRYTEKILDATSRCLRAAHCGSIILEFAICMPILIILLFYINDVIGLKRLHSQTEFVAQQMANILQNISQKREGADRKITLPDIRYAASLAYLSMFPGESRFMQQSGSTKHVSDFGYNPLGYIYYVEGNPDSTASVVWARRFHLADGTFGPSTASVDTRIERTNVKNLKNVSPSEIYPTLKINPGDKKIIIECAVHYSQSSAYSFTDGRLTSQVSPSEAFKLRLFKLSPPKTLDGKKNAAVYFHSAVIFTPKPGLFDATPPQEQN